MSIRAAFSREKTLKFGWKSAEYSQEVVAVEMKAHVGDTAGKIWHILNDNGALTLGQLKKKLNGAGDLVGFALGWLAREDKVDISQEKKSFKVVLK